MPKTETKKRRKKRRRYRLVIPWLEEARKNSEAQSPVKKRRKKTRFKLRNVRKEVWFVLAGIVVLLGVLLIPGAIEKSKLKKLGYNKETITAIRRQKLAKTLIDNQYYSEYLASCIRSGTVNTDYLSLYTVIEGEKYLDDTDFLMVGRLRDKGYVEEQILNLYKNLRFVDITPLLIYDYQVLEQGYIDDCLAHPDNSRSSFVLTHNFYTPYENTYSADPNRTDMLVNKTWHLDETYEPKELTPLSVHCGASGTQLSKEAADAMEEWAAGGKAVGVSFYATSSYRSYDSQKALYDNDKKVYNYTALTTYKNAIAEMLGDMSKYKVTVISAYNLDFDLKALEWTANSYAENLTERLTKKLNSLAHIDLYRLACYSILRTQQYIEYALKNELRSHTGKNIGTGAECCYKYINNNTAYEEEHTALADVYDELEILKHLLKVLTKKDIMDIEVYGIDAQAWKIVKAFATQLAKA